MQPPASTDAAATTTRIEATTRSPETPTSDPFLLALRDVESSGGVDCKVSSAGAVGCYQILPATARLERCHPSWRRDQASAAACAQRWLDRGERLCRRWDVYAAARWYYRGRCMRRADKPWGYELDVARARLKYL